MKKIKKVLVLGSGAIKIGEAGEFDYSGSQAVKALKEEGIKVILVNPNIATIQTSKELVDDVYFLPINPYFVEKIIEKEKPDGILLAFGGQTALNCGLALEKLGVLKKHKITVLGTPVKAIRLTEDRQKFAEFLAKINIPIPNSKAATTIKEAEKIAKHIGFPVMIRAGFALGGQGSGVAANAVQLRKIASNALAFAPQILVEKYLHHFKEIEYEVVRDKYDNCITVCNMENMDPLGIHTGDSIVVAPSQTLNNKEYYTLRKVSIEIAKNLGIVGECNVQFALNPKPKGNEIDFYVIEVNARLSRSSALASKATGYPLAYIAAKLGLGYSLTELTNKVTGTTQACFEPALDYVVVKIPRWDLEKFKGAAQELGSSMKSVGEVMGIGRTFEEAYQKAIRMLDLDYEGATSEKLIGRNLVIENIKIPTPGRMFALAKAIKKGVPVEKIYKLTGIDPWFLYRIKNIVDSEKSLKTVKQLDAATLLKLKQLGFSDKMIGQLINKTGLEIRALRKKLGILPSVLQIDTLSAEFPAKTNYLYMTYNAFHDDVKKTGNAGVIVLGSGPYRIGSSVEFDWCSVNTVFGLKKHNKRSIIINCNPETVSTDYDVSDRLYFEELTFERITDIYEFENPLGVIVSVGGQTPNNRAKALHNYKVKILGTSPKSIDTAEDRGKFSALLDRLGIGQPAWKEFTSLLSAQNFAKEVGFPVLIRPSYVLSGAAMNICFTQNDLEKYLHEATLVSKEYPVIVSKFFEKAKEIELDAIAQKGEIKAKVISEHIENAGVHSGDATIVLPTQGVNEKTRKGMIRAAQSLAKSLNITGPFNIQFLAKDNQIYIIEINLRASRTFPFITKVTGINLITMFVDSLFKKNIKKVDIKPSKFVAVKVAQFSFARLTGAHPTLGVEMASTGEVACFGKDEKEAYLKGILSTGGVIPSKGIFASIGGEDKKKDFLQSARYLVKLKLPIYATEKTTKFLRENGISVTLLYKIHEDKSPNILDYYVSKKIDLAINVVDKHFKKDVDDDLAIRRNAVDNNIPVFTKLSQIKLFAQALSEKKVKDLLVKPWSEYL
ncbi:MAG: carbamoyl-phosphate synthase (glutamine-hydrolyzing) large subunit [Patescibacteria group bacterium]|nr:carbamoyl-phosphate synthase (glutamine-hydrolyzing) large subunit [Patescibacteria group bacterium]